MLIGVAGFPVPARTGVGDVVVGWCVVCLCCCLVGLREVSSSFSSSMLSSSIKTKGEKFLFYFIYYDPFKHVR